LRRVSSDKARNTARTVATLLDLKAVTIEYSVKDICAVGSAGLQPEQLIESYARIAIRQLPNDRGIRRLSAIRPEDQKIVPQGMHFCERHLHRIAQ